MASTEFDTALTSAIDGSKTSIDMEVSDISRKPIFLSLAAAMKRGVTVRIVVSAAHVNDVSVALGAAAVHGPRAGLDTHAELAVFDGTRAVIGSEALFADSLTTDRVFASFVDEPSDVSQLATIVDHDWKGTDGSPTFDCTRLLLSPGNVRERLTDFIDQSTTKLDLELLEITDAPVLAAIAARAEAGVHVRVLLDDPRFAATNPATAETLSKAGAEVRYYRRLALKSSLVVTDLGALVGSHQLSPASIDQSRDVSVVIANPAPMADAAAAFEADWAGGTAQ